MESQPFGNTIQLCIFYQNARRNYSENKEKELVISYRTFTLRPLLHCVRGTQEGMGLGRGWAGGGRGAQRWFPLGHRCHQRGRPPVRLIHPTRVTQKSWATGMQLVSCEGLACQGRLRDDRALLTGEVRPRETGFPGHSFHSSYKPRFVSASLVPNPLSLGDDGLLTSCAAPSAPRGK